MGISGGGGAVKVDAQWAIDNQIQQTQGYAADGKAIYVVAMYHQMHCVVSGLDSYSLFFPKNPSLQKASLLYPLTKPSKTSKIT